MLIQYPYDANNVDDKVLYPNVEDANDNWGVINNNLIYWWQINLQNNWFLTYL